jgi:hypothetical protein
MGKRRGVATALVLTAASAAAAVLVKKRAEKRRPHVGLYFEDGSMVSLPDSSPQAAALLDLGREAVQVARHG